MIARDAVEQNIPVLEGVRDGDHVRVFCPTCFTFHRHGSDGLKVPHCLFSAGWYYITLVEESPDAYAYLLPSGLWRVRCWKGHWHRSKALGPIDRPHLMDVSAAPAPGSPVYCTSSDRFFDLRSADQVTPGYSDRELARYGYLPALAWN